MAHPPPFAWQEAAPLKPLATRFPLTPAFTHFARALGAARKARTTTLCVRTGCQPPSRFVVVLRAYLPRPELREGRAEMPTVVLR